MRLDTKSKRLEAQATQFTSLINNGYTKEIYKGLTIFVKGLILKVFRDTAAQHILFTQYRTGERLEEVKQALKNNYDAREQRKKDEKGNRKPTASAACAAAIREELKNAYPGVKFSVTSSNFAGGNSVDISWLDGPTSDQVQAITSKYRYGHFDGMEDIYEYSNSRDDIPQAKFVSENRSMSEEVTASITEQLKTQWGAEYIEGLHDSELGTLIYRKFQDMDLYTPTQTKQAAPQFKPVETITGEVNIIDYSDKSFAVIGDTKPIKDALKSLGGKFNFRLTCGAGWVFPKSKLDQVQTALGDIFNTPEEPIEPEPEEIRAVEADQIGPEQVQEYDNLKDIEDAANSGQVISISNLYEVIKNTSRQQNLF